MPAGSTYTPIATYTVTGGTATSYTFTSIPSTYTDLILVAQMAGNYTSSDVATLTLQVGNGSIDTGSNYSVTTLIGNGSTATSGRTTSQTQMAVGVYPLGTSSSTQQNMLVAHFMNYSNTSTNKTVLARSTNVNTASPSTQARVGLWRSTSAINQIRIKDFGDTYYFYPGTYFTLYGIAAA
jgi:hypothetical protein